MAQALRVFVMGIAATAAIDLWATFANRVLGWPRTNWALVGRWIGHMRDGQFAHASIGSSRPIAHESIFGWAFHYGVGCIYAALYLMFVSIAQAGLPTLPSAVLFGLVSILSPWLLMQPALGLGICASKAPRANLVRLQNLIIHTTFGLVLYLAYRASDGLA